MTDDGLNRTGLKSGHASSCSLFDCETLLYFIDPLNTNAPNIQVLVCLHANQSIRCFNIMVKCYKWSWNFVHLYLIYGQMHCSDLPP